VDYFNHNDERGKIERLRVAINKAERAAMRMQENDSAWGLITLVMDRRELQRRIAEAARLQLEE
jgi:hypothetical protein